MAAWGKSFCAVPVDRPTHQWSVRRMRDHPEPVAQIHLVYLAAGADIATANTFAIQRYRLQDTDLEADFEALYDIALTAAAQARVAPSMVTVNPTKAADRMREGDEGFHTWTASEMAQFLRHHQHGSKARLMIMLALNTGAARADLCRMTWGNVHDGQIGYKRGKTKIGGDYPILPNLERELALLPRDVMVLIHHGKGLPYKLETLGNWFKDQCKAAGLPHCSLHGIRKGQATAIADRGGTEFQVMAFLAHATPEEVATYTRKADRGRLTDSGLSRLSRANPEQTLSNLGKRLDKSTHYPLKRDGKNE